MARAQDTVAKLSAQIAACRICADSPLGNPLPHVPRPVAVLSSTARIAICGQAPGTRVHQSGRPFTDPSGDRLRHWMGVDAETFYDARRIAIVPMGFCFPGLDRHGGDLPPRRECRLSWHDRVFAAMPQLELKLAIGGAAHRYHLGGRGLGGVTGTVAGWRSILAESEGDCRVLPLPHPSWRNNAWFAKNPWFDSELLPELRKLIQALV